MQAEVLYGILGATGRMNDGEAVVEVIRVYNEWLADFCSTHPERFAGLASIPNAPIDAAIAEVSGWPSAARCAGSTSPTPPISPRSGIPTGIRSGR